MHEEIPNLKKCTLCGKLASDPEHRQSSTDSTDSPPAELTGSPAYPWMKESFERHASDLFLSATQRPVIKLLNDFIPLRQNPLSAEEVSKIIASILPEKMLNAFRSGQDVDLAIDVKGLARFRLNTFRQLHGSALAMRPLPHYIPTMDELLLPKVLNELSRLTSGLILITGPTGCGKSTTLAALIHTINQRDQKNIITIEDPIEYIIPSRRSLIHQREVGTHVTSFANGLRSALREHPDIIVVGELRDLESISLAIRAAETGHLVLGTLHSTDATQAITRITDVFDSNRQPQIRVQLAQSLQGIISQRLFRHANKPKMVVATEVMIATMAIRTLIRENRTLEIRGYIETGIREQMNTLRQSVEQRIREGRLDEHCLAELNTNPAHELTDDEIRIHRDQQTH
ncbi:MAG: PilT/PilU family type 4a pilus ATPase [Candidatus Omnitrophica bacterium]|nr:PilT/PilU family type 4a pilus ATPase [Candidatus Omnitrophota bacterium]